MSIIISYIVDIILIIGFGILAVFSYGCHNCILLMNNDRLSSKFKNDKQIQAYANLSKPEKDALSLKMIRTVKIYALIMFTAFGVAYMINII